MFCVRRASSSNTSCVITRIAPRTALSGARARSTPSTTIAPPHVG
jgi:hypothetical protein